MTADDFKDWRNQMGLSQRDAAAALGLSRPTIENYERGHRIEDGRPVGIPRTVALACTALFHRMEPWGGNAPKVISVQIEQMLIAPPGLPPMGTYFQIVKYLSDGTKAVGGQVFSSREEAKRAIEAEVFARLNGAVLGGRSPD